MRRTADVRPEGVFRFVAKGDMIRRMDIPDAPAGRASSDREAMLMYRTVADFTFDWEIWLGPDGRMRYVSPSCRRITGYDPRDIQADPDFFARIIHPDDYPVWRERMDQGHERGVPSMDFRIRRADGVEVWLAQETTLVRGPDSEPLGLRLSLREVTDRVAAQTALREANEGLEQRVRERTAELERTNAELRREIKRGEKARKSLEESRERIRNLSANLQDRVEDERRRISREIHDELGQTLTAVGMGLARLEQRPPADEAATRSQIAGLRELAGSALDTVRRIARELRPAILDDLGLCEAASAHTRSFAESTGIDVDLETPPAPPNLDPEQTTALYRVLQEALTNVARHAGATRVRVRLAATRRGLTLTVADNGRGAPESDLCDPRAYGILGMRERMRFFGGEAHVASEPGRGTTVTAVLPLGRRRKK